jgi:site-specific DNA recombinase
VRAFVYTRQSLDRTGLGAAVERQREDCLKLCAERGWTVVEKFSDNDVSASSTRPRPQYQRMLAAIEAREAEVVVAWHVDRLTRKLTELEALIELSSRTGVRIATVTGDLDLTTDAGRLVGRILASVARGEVERKGARQKRAQQQAAQQGRPAGGRRAFGYGADGVTVDRREAKYLRAAYQGLLEGRSLKGLAADWNGAGVLTTMGNAWTHSVVRRTLLNPRYAGRRTYRGEVVGPGTWTALVDEDTFDAASALLTLPERRTTTGNARLYLLPGLARCWCGSDVMTGRSRSNKRSYDCRKSKHLSRAAEPIDELVEAVVIERLSRLDAADLLSEPSTPDLAVYRARAQAIRERLDDLATGLEEGLLTLTAVRKSSDRLRHELAETDAKMQTATHADVLGPLVTATDVAAAWQGYDLQQKRGVIDALMVVTLLAPKRGRQAFDPETVRIEWNGAGQ